MCFRLPTLFCSTSFKRCRNYLYSLRCLRIFCLVCSRWPHSFLGVRSLASFIYFRSFPFTSSAFPVQPWRRWRPPPDHQWCRPWKRWRRQRQRRQWHHRTFHFCFYSRWYVFRNQICFPLGFRGWIGFCPFGTLESGLWPDYTVSDRENTICARRPIGQNTKRLHR